jgi:DNA-binding MarR family transcriptional regulator
MEQNPQVIEKIRAFNRYYTNVIGLLDQHYLDSPFSLTEGRVLYEIAHIENCSAKKIREKISIDEGYLSRIIDKFIQKGLVTKSPAPEDRRLHLIFLTEKGRQAFASLNEHSDRLISKMIEKLSKPERAKLVSMMEKIHKMLENG